MSNVEAEGTLGGGGFIMLVTAKLRYREVEMFEMVHVDADG